MSNAGDGTASRLSPLVAARRREAPVVEQTDRRRRRTSVWPEVSLEPLRLVVPSRLGADHDAGNVLCRRHESSAPSGPACRSAARKARTRQTPLKRCMMTFTH